MIFIRSDTVDHLNVSGRMYQKSDGSPIPSDLIHSTSWNVSGRMYQKSDESLIHSTRLNVSEV